MPADPDFPEVPQEPSPLGCWLEYQAWMSNQSDEVTVFLMQGGMKWLCNISISRPRVLCRRASWCARLKKEKEIRQASEPHHHFHAKCAGLHTVSLHRILSHPSRWSRYSGALWDTQHVGISFHDRCGRDSYDWCVERVRRQWWSWGSLRLKLSQARARLLCEGRGKACSDRDTPSIKLTNGIYRITFNDSMIAFGYQTARSSLGWNTWYPAVRNSGHRHGKSTWGRAFSFALPVTVSCTEKVLALPV